MTTMAATMTAETIRSRRYARCEPRAARTTNMDIRAALATTMTPRIETAELTMAAW